MNPTYKLVVVQPFDSYQRGDIIFDQCIVEAILDQTNEKHHNEQHVRKVPLSDAEKASLYSVIVPAPSFTSSPVKPEISQPEENAANEQSSSHEPELDI